MTKILTLAILLSFAQWASALNDTLNIIRDSIDVNGLVFAQCTFSANENFSLQNKHLQADVAENIQLTIINTDVLDHSFTIDGIVDESIAAQSTEILNFSINQAGTYRYYSDYSYASQIGASGILQIGYQSEISYFWNLNEVNTELSHLISNQSITEIPIEYNPELFFVNGYFFPSTLADVTSHISQVVGDEIYISIVNSGNMEHVLHFHGFHVEILDMKISYWQEGWTKDTFPLKKGEAMTVKLVPDQPGEFPVHDHNLIAVTNVGLYPGGMITWLSISE